MTQIYQDTVRHIVVIEGIGEFPLNQLTAEAFVEEGVSQVLISLNGDEVDRFPFQDIENQVGDPAASTEAGIVAYLQAQFSGGNPVLDSTLSELIQEAVDNGSLVIGGNSDVFTPFIQVEQNLVPQISENTVTSLLDDEFETYLTLTTPELAELSLIHI